MGDCLTWHCYSIHVKEFFIEDSLLGSPTLSLGKCYSLHHGDGYYKFGWEEVIPFSGS